MSAKVVAISAITALTCVALTLYFTSSNVPKELVDGASVLQAEESRISTDDDRLQPPIDAPTTTASSLSKDLGAGSKGATPVAGEAQVLLPRQAPSTPMTQSLEELRLPPVPEILETEGSFGAESIDPLWSTGMEAHILGEIAQITGLELETLHVECRTSMCRLQLAQRELPHAAQTTPFSASPDGRSRSFLELVAGLGLEPRWVMSVVDRYGNPVSLAYLARGDVAAVESTIAEPSSVR